MKSPSFRFLLPLFVTAALAGCGAAGQSIPSAGTIGTAPQQLQPGTRTVAAQSVDATSIPSGSYWSGTVSAVNWNGITANCGQANFAQMYGCLPVVTTGATISGTPVVGQYFQMWGDLSKLPNITATTINYSAAKFPVTAPTASADSASSATPSPAPSSATATGTFMSFSNAVDYPASFTPYASTSIWRQQVSANPTIASYSSAVVAYQFPNGTTGNVVRANEAGQYDYNHPRFFASTTDPLVTIRCTSYCNAPDNGGVPAQIRIPAQARPARGYDAHFDVVQPDGTEITMFGTSQPPGNWTNGATISAANVANCGSFSSGQGWLPQGPGPTAAGYCDGAGVVTAAELASGQINHALMVTGECAVGAQYPVESYGSTDRCTSGVGPPLGGREWYDVPCSTTQANAALRPWEKAILCALNVYGGFMGDDGGGGAYFTGGIGPEVESEEPWYDFQGPNYTSPFAVLAAQGWYSFPLPAARSGSVGVRWVGANPWHPAGVNFPAHIHWLDPCSARGTC